MQTTIKSFQRTFLAAIFSGLSINAYAVAPGFYMGIMAGPAVNNALEQSVATLSGTPATTTAKPRAQQFGTRFFFGNKLNDYAGMELGLSFFSGISYSTDVPAANGLVSRVRDIDFVGKGTMSLGNQFDLFAKAGIAYAYMSNSGGLNSTGKTQYQSKFAPTLGVGGSYDLNQNWVVDLSANTLFLGGQVSRMTSLAVGISYHFVDKYCGQFLCDD